MFILTDPGRLSFESLAYLQKAIEKNPLSGDPTIWDILDDCRKGDGEIYTFSKGAFYLEYHPKLINVALLGGDDIDEWKNEFSAFVKNIMKKKNIKHLSVIGRSAWHKIFKELKPIGMFYIMEN